MPGNSPAEAVREFLAPLQNALSCVTQAKVTTRKGGDRPKVGDSQQWSLNDGAAAKLKPKRGGGSKVKLPSPLQFYAHMWWRVIEDDREGYGPYRVTTTGYDYSLVCGRNETEVWAMHWHPDGSSDETKPHVHLGDVLLSDGCPIDSQEHLITSRMTFETAIRWLVAFGAKPRFTDWKAHLLKSEMPHLRSRTWHADPDEAESH